MSLRKIRFWVCLFELDGKPRIRNGIHRTKAEAKTCCVKGDQLVQCDGFWNRADGLVLNRQGRWVKP